MSNVAEPTLILLGCVKTKLDRRAKAKDLYVSPLWAARRRYAERSRKSWMILSARHGLLDPEEEVETYDVALARLSAAERADWGSRVVAALEQRLGVLGGSVFEVHAGGAYRLAVEGLIAERGGRVTAPLAHLPLGYQQRWYADHTAGEADLDVRRRRESTDHELRAALRALDGVPARVWVGGWPGDLANLDRPGLYSWWTDAKGARDLGRGIGVAVSKGRIYAGQTGATKWPSGRTGKMTLKTASAAAICGARCTDRRFAGRSRPRCFPCSISRSLPRAD